MKPITALTAQQLRQAADIQEKIEELRAELDRILGSSGSVVEEQSLGRGRRRRRLSAEGLANIRAGVRRRMARVRSDTRSTSVTQPGRKHTMSATGRKSLSEKMKARWNRVKAAGRSTL